MAYRYSLGNDNSNSCACPSGGYGVLQSDGACNCEIPQHTEMVSVPNHAYTQHTQPTTWITKTVSYNQVPVTQTLTQQQHPTVCIGAPKAKPIVYAAANDCDCA